jgi:hypothetical protein
MAKKIKKGKVLEELVKGSMEYTMQLIMTAFRAQFPRLESYNTLHYYISEVFSDYVIVSCYGDGSPLKSDEYFKVSYSKSGDVYTFAARDEWEVVELAYQPQTSLTPSPSPVGEGKNGKRKGKRFEERVDARVALQEAEEGKPRRIRIEGAMTANVVNGNNRRYPSSVLESAVAELGGHLNESPGQGRAAQILGEAEHPSDKGGRPNLLETVTKWAEVAFDGSNVNLTGHIVETSKGKDILTLMENGVMPGVSMRGYGEGKNVKNGDEKIFEVTELHITGFDLVLEPSFENAAELIESQSSMEDDMNVLEELKKLLAEHPELFGNGMTEAQLEALNEKQLKKLDESLRSALGIDANANIVEAVKANADKAKLYDAMQARLAVDAAITEATKDLPFGKTLNGMFIASITEANLSTPEAVKQFAESKRKEYGKLAAAGALKGMGFDEKTKSVRVIGDVLESETGTPEFARASFELVESIQRAENLPVRNLSQGVNAAEIFTRRLLERFDMLHSVALMAESQMLQEATLTTDLNIPYSVSRAIIEETFPNLVAANIFDVGTIETSPTRLYFEATTGETGYAVDITDEVETAGVENTWYALSHGRITPGSVVVTSNPAGTTYVEGTDFVIDYAAGKIKALTAGSINANDVLVDYSYSAIRNGEMQPIERVKTSLAYITIEAAADRLADQISREAIVFSRSQLGWDAVARTMANLIKQLRRKIDQGLLYAAFSAVMSVPDNSTDTWTVDTAQTALAELVRLMGNANVIVGNRFYEPTFYLMSVTNADRLSNWEGYMRDGFPNVLLNAAGFAGMVKGKPIFASTEFPDTLIIAGNRELVQHRVFLPLSIKGPFPTYATTGDVTRLVAADQYYAEEFNSTNVTVNEKGAFVPINDAGS